MNAGVYIAGGGDEVGSNIAGLVRALGLSAHRIRSVEELVARTRLGGEGAVVVCGAMEGSRVSDVLRALRGAERNGALPTIVVGEQDDRVERIVAFELGADDYVSLPLDEREFSLRLAAILRRVRSGEPTRSTRQRHGRLEIDIDERRVWVDGQAVELSPTEFRTLQALTSPAGVVHTREALQAAIDVGERVEGGRFVDARVARLRHSLGPAGRQIETVRGVGYRIDAGEGRVGR